MLKIKLWENLTNTQRQSIKNLFGTNKVIPILFTYFLLLIVIKGPEIMNWVTWIVFGILILGLSSLFFDSWRIIKKGKVYP